MKIAIIFPKPGDIVQIETDIESTLAIFQGKFKRDCMGNLYGQFQTIEGIQYFPWIRNRNKIKYFRILLND